MAEAVDVVAIARPHLTAVLVVDEHAHVDLVLLLVDDDLADPFLVPAERDTEFEFAEVPFPESERATDSPRSPIRTIRCPLPAPSGVCLGFPLDDQFAPVVLRPSLPRGKGAVPCSFQ